MDFGSIAIMLMIASLILLVAEIFLPSGGILAALTVLSMVASIYFGYRQWYETSPLYFGIFLASAMLLFPTTLMGAFYVLPKTSFGKRVILTAQQESEVRGHAEEEEHLELLIGKQGTAVNTLMPGGMIEIDGIRYHASSRGLPVESGQPVQVLKRSGLRLIVKEIDPSQQADLAKADPMDQPTEESSGGDLVDPLDIDFAQG